MCSVNNVPREPKSRFRLGGAKLWRKRREVDGGGPGTSRLLRGASYIRIWLPIVISTMAFGAVAYEYEATGTFEGSRPLADGKIAKQQKQWFHICVRGCQWQVRVVPEDAGPGFEFLDYLESGFDGHDLRTLVSLKANAPGKDRWGGNVTHEPVPLLAIEPHVPVIWLALASTCYLDRAGTSSLVAVYSASVARAPVAVKVMRKDEPPRLPEKIFFLSDGYDRRVGQPRKWPPPYDKGFTNAIYEATAFTNIAGLNLPLHFTVRVLRPGPRGLETDIEYYGDVDNIRPTCALKEFGPIMPSGASAQISDFRFVSADALSKHPFRYRTDRWLGEAEVENLPGFGPYAARERELKTIPPVLAKPAPSRPGPRWARICVVAFAAGTAVPLIFLWLRKPRKLQERNSKP